MENMQDKTIRELAKSCQTVEEVQNLLKSLFKDTLQTSNASIALNMFDLSQGNILQTA